MSYTPINWQTGDTITAEKLNKMDNGWGIENTQLLSETVTTAESQGLIMGTLTYSSVLDADVLTVTFNGTNYSCSRIEAFESYFYGGFTEQGPDFSEYPFAIQSSESGGENTIYTATAGTYTVAVILEEMAVSGNFAEAVEKAYDYKIILGTTTWTDACTALNEGKIVYSISGTFPYLIRTTFTSSAFDQEIYKLHGFKIASNGTVEWVTYFADTYDGTLYV